MAKSTWKQQDLLKNLGFADGAKLSSAEASTMIERLISQQEASGSTVSCPYCKKAVSPRERKCPHCGKRNVNIRGKLYTKDAAEKRAKLDLERDEKEWFKEERANVKANIRDDWKDEQEFRREFKEKHTVGYILKIGRNCDHASHLQGLLVKIEDAKANPDMLPPYDGCRHDTCECEYELVSPDRVPKRTRVAELAKSPQKRKRKSGCLGMVLLVLLIVTVCTLL